VHANFGFGYFAAVGLRKKCVPRTFSAAIRRLLLLSVGTPTEEIVLDSVSDAVSTADQLSPTLHACFTLLKGHAPDFRDATEQQNAENGDSEQFVNEAYLCWQ
jgi:hypothetical protein